MVTLFGLPESVYVRIVRLVLEAKGIRCGLERADPFSENGLPAGYQERHPFGRIPAIEVDDVHLFETDAIVHYLDALWLEPRLMPSDPLQAARARQIMRLIDNYAYRALVWGVYVPIWWRDGAEPEQAAIDLAGRSLDVLEALSLQAGLTAEPSLAGFYLAAMLAPFDSVKTGSVMLDRRDSLRAWWDLFRGTGPMLATRSEHARY